jgi:hypothetical protein
MAQPNKLHHLALAEWVAVWPSLRLYAPNILQIPVLDHVIVTRATRHSAPWLRPVARQVDWTFALGLRDRRPYEPLSPVDAPTSPRFP